MRRLVAEPDKHARNRKSNRKALLDKLAIEREQQRLEDENRDLKSIVKQVSEPARPAHLVLPHSAKQQKEGPGGAGNSDFCPEHPLSSPAQSAALSKVPRLQAFGEARSEKPPAACPSV